MPLCNHRACTWPTAEPLAGIVTRRPPTPTPPTPLSLPSTNQLLLFLVTAGQGCFFFFNISIKRAVCGSSVCFLFSMLHHCHSDQWWQVVLHVSDMTAVRLFEDYLVLLPRGAHRERITSKKKVTGSVQCWAPSTVVQVFQAAGRWHSEGHRKEESSVIHLRISVYIIWHFAD